MKISFAIPVLASKYTKALQLCIQSIVKYCKYPFDIYIQIDNTDKELSKEFCLKEITDLYKDIIYKNIVHEKPGSHKNELVQWVLHESDSEYIIAIHSDVIFFSDLAIKNLVEPLIKDETKLAAYWTVPLVEYASTYHMDESKKKNFYIAPRISSWIFSLNRVNFNNLSLEHEELKTCFLGYQWIKNGQCASVDPEYLAWFSKQDHYKEYIGSGLDCIIDIGCMFLYYIDKYSFHTEILGTEENPSMSNLKFRLRNDRYVHVEQYDPKRFNNSLYSQDLLDLRTHFLERIEESDFNIEACEDIFIFTKL